MNHMAMRLLFFASIICLLLGCVSFCIVLMKKQLHFGIDVHQVGLGEVVSVKTCVPSIDSNDIMFLSFIRTQGRSLWR